MSLLEVGPLAQAVLENKDHHHAYSEVKLAAIFPKGSFLGPLLWGLAKFSASK